jgi:four helix bundle protein
LAGFRELVVWQRAIENSVAIYKLTSRFPSQEVYGLTSQLRRASVSVASNIAEGYGRTSSGEYRQFLGMARGSNSEVETQLVIAKKLEFADELAFDRAAELTVEVGKMLNSMIGKISRPASADKSLVPSP